MIGCIGERLRRVITSRGWAMRLGFPVLTRPADAHVEQLYKHALRPAEFSNKALFKLVLSSLAHSVL
jgi:hypothetical protein